MYVYIGLSQGLVRAPLLRGPLVMSLYIYIYILIKPYSLEHFVKWG